MLRSLFVCTICAALLFPTVARFSAIVSFYMHRDEIALTQCENREVKGSCCKGSCVLKKDLEKKSEQPAKLPFHLKEKTEWISQAIPQIHVVAFVSKLKHHITYQSTESEAYPASCFVPPSRG